MKKVSAILPNYNYAKYFHNRVKGILNQTYPVSELIILDDASTDDSREIIEQEIAKIKITRPDLRIVTNFNKKNSGSVFHQWQKGIELATNDYIWICELDDLSENTFLETAMQGFEKNPKTILSYTNSKFITSDNRADLKSELRQVKNFFRENRPKGIYTRNGEEELKKTLIFYNTIPNISAAVFRKSPEIDFKSVLKEASKFKLAGDWYFYSELLLHGDIFYSPRRLNLHRIHQGSVTMKTNVTERFNEIIAIQKKIASGIDIDEESKRKILRYRTKLAKKWGII